MTRKKMKDQSKKKITRSITLDKHDVALLRKIGNDNVSHGIRILIEKYKNNAFTDCEK